jgi:GNAT superfamily N-acetyltransferase
VTWKVTEVSVGDATVQDLLYRYLFDVASSYWGRPATTAEMTQVVADHPSDDLAPPGGLFLLGLYAGEPAGCVGLRFGAGGFAELARMFVAPEFRGRGGGAVLLAASEERARARNVHTIRLDTRQDLIAARRLYAANGYEEIPAYSEGPYAQCWYAKHIAQPAAPASPNGRHPGT